MKPKRTATYLQKRGNKYRAKSSIYNDVYYHSRLEAAYAQELDLRVKAKDIKSWKRQVRIPLIVNDQKITTYIIDFVVTHNDGTEEYVECKGFETDTWRLKWKLALALFPERNWTVVKK